MTQEVAPSDKNSNREENDQVNKFLAEALNGKSEEFKKQVLSFAVSCGLSQDDPLFLILVATGQLEAMLTNAPSVLQLLFETWNQDLARNLQEVEKVTVLRQKVAIDRAAHALRRQSTVYRKPKTFNFCTSGRFIIIFHPGSWSNFRNFNASLDCWDDKWWVYKGAIEYFDLG